MTEIQQNLTETVSLTGAILAQLHRAVNHGLTSRKEICALLGFDSRSDSCARLWGGEYKIGVEQIASLIKNVRSEKLAVELRIILNGYTARGGDALPEIISALKQVRDTVNRADVVAHLIDQSQSCHRALASGI